MQPLKPTYKQFSLTDPKTLAHDKRYWSHQLSAALETYGCTKPDNEDSREAKAVACATLAGLGLALHGHFGKAVEALGCAEHQSCTAAGLRAFDGGKAHTDKMEAAALKTLS